MADLKSWRTTPEVAIGSGMATTEEADETANILDALAREFDQNRTETIEESELSIVGRYSTFEPWLMLK